MQHIIDQEMENYQAKKQTKDQKMVHIKKTRLMALLIPKILSQSKISILLKTLLLELKTSK